MGLVALALVGRAGGGDADAGPRAGAIGRGTDPLRGGARRWLRRRAVADRHLRRRNRATGAPAHADDRLRGRLPSGPGRLSPLSGDRMRRRSRRGACASHRPAYFPGHRLRPRDRLSAGHGRPPKRRGSAARASAPAVSTSNTGSTTRTRRPCATFRSSATRANTATTGNRSRSGSTLTARPTSAPRRTTATTTRCRTSTGAPTPASTSSANWPKTSTPANRMAGARRPASCSSPAAATPATPRAPRAAAASSPVAASTWCRWSRSPPTSTPPSPWCRPWLKEVWRDPEATGTG